MRHVIGSDSVELTHFFDSLGGTRFGLMHSLAPRDMTHQHSKTLSRYLENDEHPPKDQSVLPKGVCERIILQCEQNKLQYPVLPASMKPKLGLAEIHEGNMSKRNISLDQAKANDKMAKLQNEHKAGLERTQLCKSTPGFQFVGKTRTIDMFLSQ